MTFLSNNSQWKNKITQEKTLWNYFINSSIVPTLIINWLLYTGLGILKSLRSSLRSICFVKIILPGINLYVQNGVFKNFYAINEWKMCERHKMLWFVICIRKRVSDGIKDILYSPLQYITRSKASSNHGMDWYCIGWWIWERKTVYTGGSTGEIGECELLAVIRFSSWERSQ